jgi:hypothetical protein
MNGFRNHSSSWAMVVAVEMVGDGDGDTEDRLNISPARAFERVIE